MELATFTVTASGVLGLVIAAQGALLVVVLLALPSGNVTANRCLSFFLAMEAVRMGTYFLYFSDIPAPSAFYYAPAISVLAGPALYLYVRALVEPEFRFSPRLLPILLPVLPLPLLLLFLDVGAEVSPGPFIGSNIAEPVMYIHLVYDLVFIAYTVGAISHLSSHRQRVETLFSSIHRVDLHWLKRVLLVSLLTWSVYLVIDALRLAGLLDLGSRMLINQLSSLLIIYLISIGGMRQPEIFTMAVRSLILELGKPGPVAPPSANVNAAAALADDYARLGIDEDAAAVVWAALEKHMQEQQTYLDNQLSLAGLADALSVSPQVLSLVINRKAQATFYDYVNGFRVERAQELMKNSDKARRNLLDIAHEAGFNSQSTFYNHFKKRVGVTPRQYRQSHGNQLT